MEAHCFRSFMVWYLSSFEGWRVQDLNFPHSRIHSRYLNLRIFHYNTHPSGSERSGTFLWQWTCGALAGWKSAPIRRCQPIPCPVKDDLVTPSPKGNAFKYFYPERRYECWKQFLVMCFWGGPRRPCLGRAFHPLPPNTVDSCLNLDGNIWTSPHLPRDLCSGLSQWNLGDVGALGRK